MPDGTVVDLAALAGTDTEGSVETEYGTLTFKVTNYVSAIKMDPTVEDSKHKNAEKAKFIWSYKRGISNISNKVASSHSNTHLIDLTVRKLNCKKKNNNSGNLLKIGFYSFFSSTMYD